MLINGEVASKIVLIGPRGAASHVLARRPEAWEAQAWYHEEGLGEPGEPPMDLTSFSVGREDGGQKHRVYFFGHGISVDDFLVLGADTRRAMFTRMDRLVIVLDGAAPGFGRSFAGDATVPSDGTTAIGIRGWDGPTLTVGERPIPVTVVDDAGIGPWLDAIFDEMVALAPQPVDRQSGA